MAASLHHSIVTVLLLMLSCAEGQSEREGPARIPAQTAASSDTCPAGSESASKNEIRQNIIEILEEGNYSCDGTAGWTRVAYLNYNEPPFSCPQGLGGKTLNGVRGCGRATGFPSCWSTFYQPGSFAYSSICGRIRGYQYGQTTAFSRGYIGIDGSYVEGVSLTHGPPGNRTHIWTFAAGLSEVTTYISPGQTCPCVMEGEESPSFVGDDYFCESGLQSPWAHGYRVYYDALWDGQNCINNCMCQPHLPFFVKNLQAPTTDNIELRICSHSEAHLSDILIDEVELYVK